MKTDTIRKGLRKAASLLCAAMVLVVSVGTGLIVTPLVAHAADYRAVLKSSNELIIYDPANPNQVMETWDPSNNGINFGSLTQDPNDRIRLEVTGDINVNRRIVSHCNLIITGNGGKLSSNYIEVFGDLVIENANIEAITQASSINGIYVRGNLTIKNSTVIAESNNTYNKGDGIKLHPGNNPPTPVTGNLVIENSTVTASGKNGINNEIGNVTIDAGSRVTATGTNHGINALSNITIANGANVEAAGGTGNALNAPPGNINAPGYDPSNPKSYKLSTIVIPAAVSGSAGCAGGHASVHWETVYEADAHNDGEMVCRCDSCGEVLYRIPVSAYGVFSKTTMQKIMDAPQGATVEVKTSRWISFHKMVMQALANRPDVALKVSFLDGEYRGNRMTFTIPAGYDALSLPNEEGYCGFLYLGGIFGLHPEERGAQSTNAPLSGT